MIEYLVELTTFASACEHNRHRLAMPFDVLDVLDVPETGCEGSCAIFVAALDGQVDRGNFYLFRNSTGFAYVKLHEHRELLPRDPQRVGVRGSVAFNDEDGAEFEVPALLTTSWERARSALEYWLRHQQHWPEFQWE